MKRHHNLLIALLIVPYFSIAQQKSTDIKYGDNPVAGKYLNTRGIKLYYEIYGSGDPILFIHGNGGSIEMFKYQLRYFSRFYKCIAVDSRAQGKSVDKKDSLSYEMMADDFNALLDNLHLDSVNVVGWSDGGINGLLLAINHPVKVKMLAITGANLRPDTSAVDSAGINFVNELKEKLSKEKQNDETKNTMKLVHLLEAQPNIPVESLHKIKCPVLVIGGDHDVIKPEHTLEIYRNIPRAYLWILPRSGHGTPIRYKEEFNLKVLNFFSHPYGEVNWIDWE